MAEITLKGRRIPLAYTVLEMKQIQEEVAPIGEFLYTIFGREKDEDGDTASLYGSAKHLDAVGKALRIMGNAGLEEAGEKADLTDKWVMRALKPSMIAEAMGACLEAFNEGNASEIPEHTSGEPVDVTLEQMKKKETKEN